MCRTSVDRVRQLGALSEKRGDFVTLDQSQGVVGSHKDRIGTPHHINLQQGHFVTVISARTLYGGHPGLLEAQAIRLALEWVGRAVSRLGHRIVLLVDAKAVLGAVAKGRSSSRLLRKIIARISALCLATDTTLHLLYVPSEHNPADAPSRGATNSKTSPRKVRHKTFRKQPRGRL